MLSLSTRQCAILKLLLQANKSMSALQIASHLDITPRMVRYDLSALRSWLQARSLHLIMKPNYGIRIEASSRARTNLEDELGNLGGYGLVLSPAERVQVLTFSLLTSDRPLLARQLGLLLGVSHPTVLKDMCEVEEWLEGQGLHLVRRRNFGFKIAGPEICWRRAVAALLLETLDEAALLTLCAGAKSAPQWHVTDRIGPLRAFSTLLESLEPSFCRELIDSIEEVLHVQYTDQARVSLLLHIAILIHRVQQGKTAEVPPEHLDSLRAQSEFCVAQIAAESIEQHFSISLAEPEIAYIAMQVLGAEMKRSLSDIAGEGDTKRIDPEVFEVVSTLLTEASIYLQPCLKVDQQLTRNLSFHFGAVLNRLRFDLSTRNPLLGEIRRRYPYVFEVARKASAAVADRIGKEIPDEEIGYIAMHLAAAMERLRAFPQVRKRVLIICGEGVATAWLLVSRIQVELPEIEVVDVMSTVELSKAHASRDSIDGIISTVPIGASDVSTVVVNPLLHPEDIASIREILGPGVSSLEPSASSEQITGRPLANLITAETIALGGTASSWIDVVYQTGHLLLSVGAIEPRYIEAMKEMIDRYGPYVVIMPGVALLHARPENGVKRTGMSMVILGEPVPFGHPRYDPVNVAIALATKDNHSHRRALKQLVDMLSDAEMRTRIKNARTRREILDLISIVSRQGTLQNKESCVTMTSVTD